MEKYFSLLWESEDSYREWKARIYGGEEGYIADLNLKFVYEEIYRAGKFWDQYGFEEIFLHPCAKCSTVMLRQKVMKQLYQNAVIYEAAEEFVACVSAIQRGLERIGDTKDEKKKMIFALQARYDFLAGLERVCGKVSEQAETGTPLDVGIEKMADFISDSRVVAERKRLSEFLTLLGQNMPQSIILNKDKGQNCHSVVVDPEGVQDCEYTKRLKKWAQPFIGAFDFTIGIYQNMDITYLDKRIQEQVCLRRPELVEELGGLYEAYGKYDICQFVRVARELVFYLACIRFVREYEKAGFFFCMPVCTPLQDTSVREAYDMTLAINLYQNKKGCQVVSNDYQLSDNRCIFILTGANQGGKTTFIRSVGVIQCLAQVGMFVPCRKASLGIVGNIHTLFSREDERGASVGRFEQELQRVHSILQNLQERDMVLLNETFTSTQRSTAVILLKRLLREIAHKQCRGGLVTHFYEVGDGLESEGFFSLITEVEGEGEYKERTYKIREGESFRYSYAKDIAVKCGVTYERLMEEME